MGAQRPSCRAALKEDREGQVLAKGVRTQGAPPFQCHTRKPMPDRNSVLNIWHPELTTGDSHRASLQARRCKNEESIRYVQSERNYVPAPCVKQLCREVLYPKRWARNPGNTESRGDSNTAGPLRCVAPFTHTWGSSAPRPDVRRELSSASWTRRPSYPALKTPGCAPVCEASAPSLKGVPSGSEDRAREGTVYQAGEQLLKLVRLLRGLPKKWYLMGFLMCFGVPR